MPSRITSNILSSNYLRNMQRNLANMKTLQNQLSSGKEINKASDNPYKASRSMQLNTEISYNKQYNENIKDISNWLDTTDTALAQMGNVFGRIETLLVSSGNASYGQDQRIAIQDEIKEKVNELSQILNTSFDGSYIFGGTKTGSKPTTVVNGVLQYSDSAGKEVAITAYIDSATKKITNNNGGANTAVVLPLLSTDIDALKTERENSATSKDRKEDITKVLQEIIKTPPGNVYKNGTVITSEPYVNKTITLSATNVEDLQSELNGLLKNTPTDARIDDINKLLYNTSATAPSDIATIKATELAKINSTATKLQIDQLNSISKVIPINQTDSYLKVDIAQGIVTQYNKNAVDVMEFKDKDGNQINVSELLKNIIIDLDKDGNVNNLTTNHLKDIQSVTANLLMNRSEVGSFQNRMDSAKENNETQNYNMTDILSKTEDIDLAEKTLEYSTMQTVYTAALQTSAKILPMTILSYL